MNSKSAKQTSRHGQTRPWCIAVIAAWVAGAFALSTPFNFLWRLGNGNLGYNILISLGCALIGIALLVPLTVWLSRRLRETVGRGAIGHVVAAAHMVFAICAAFALFSVWPKWGAAVGGGFLAVVLLAVSIYALCVDIGRGRRRSWGGWMRRRWSFNGAFWLGVFLALCMGDLYALWAIDDLNAFERASAALGRIATQAVITIGLMLLFHGIRGLTPKCFRPVVMVLFSLLPFLIVTDFLLRRFWNQSMLSVVNLFTSTGAFDMEKEIAASGLNWSNSEVTLAAAGVVALCAVVFWGLGLLSRTAGFRTANRHVFRVLTACWLVAVAEGGLSHATKRVEAWQKHHKAFDLHVGLFAPPIGLERIEVAFNEPAPEPSRETLLAEIKDAPGLRKPDIYVFMVESWRSDSITPEIAPFLTQFRAEECQDLGRTYAGSNCTPLSWFSFFHSRIALHWSDAQSGLESGESDRGAYPLRVLRKLGYEMHVRAVCDLGYKNLGPLNFGKDNAIASHLVDDSKRTEPKGIPKRELEAMADLRDHIESDPEAPQFHFTALDSPHYNYYWPAGFQVLHQNCASNIPTNLRPGKDVVAGVVRRYENSVHWVDYALEEFVEFLKLKGRYENSVIIITGDHGEEFQEEGSWFHCSALNRYQTEVPIIIKWPEWVGQTPPHTNVSHLDVMPSVMEMIGLEPRFYSDLSGRSLLQYDESPREAVISTFHRGETGIGLCVVRGERKVNFVFGGAWSMNIPTKLHVTGYSDLSDKMIDPRDELGERTHAQFIKDEFPAVSGRFFGRFERD